MNFKSQSIDTSMELHPNQLTGPVSRSRVTSSTPQPLGPNAQPLPPYTAPILAIAGEPTSIRFLSSCDSGSTGSVSSPSPTTTNVTLDIWGEERQRIASGRQSFHRGSHNVNYPSKGLHPSQIESRTTSQPWTRSMVPVLATARETTSPHALSFCGSGSTIDISSSLTTTDEPSSGTLTLQVIELEDIEVTCLLCGFTFIGHQASSHLREKHHNLVRKNDRSICPLCTATGTTTPTKEVTNFCRHFQKHHKVLRFKCSRCSYTALERWNVERHVQKMRGKSKCVKD